jgi:hypothetical protein
MRLRACVGLLLLGLGGCAQLPGMVRLDVDGRTVEIRQQGFAPLLAGGGWSPRACDAADGGETDAAVGPVMAIRVIGPDEIELIGPGGRAVRLYRCEP